MVEDDTPHNGIQRSLGRIEGTLEQLKDKIDGVSKGQSNMWKSINSLKAEVESIKINMARMESQKVGWRDLSGAIKTAIAALSSAMAVLTVIIGIKGGI